MDIKLKFICQDMDRHGNVRIYVRKNGRKTRLRASPSTPEFLQEYEDAVSGVIKKVKVVNKPLPTSLRWLVESYYKSANFKLLAESTQDVRRRILDNICLVHGHKPFAKMETRHIRNLRDEKADKKDGANGLLKGLRGLFKWAKEYEIINHDPAKDVSKFKVKTDGHHTWTDQEVSQYLSFHPPGTKAYLALNILYYTGVRRGDLVRLGSQMEHGEWLHFTENKNEKNSPKQRQLPISPILREVLNTVPSNQPTYLVTEYGKPFTPDGFGNWFRDRCDEAGLPQCSAHGVRKAGATFAANNGASEHQLMAFFGWTNPQQAELYTRTANRKKLAGAAMHMITGQINSNESVPPSNTEYPGGTKNEKKP